MRITFSIKKTIEQNAAVYFEKAKKAKKRLEGVKATISRYQAEHDLLLQKEAEDREEEQERLSETQYLKARPKAWYHAFRWFKTSDGFLVVGGRDATTNEVLIKKHTQPGDLVFHTDMAGSPFFIIKSDGRIVTETAKREAADATCTFSRAWKLGMARQDVFFVKPDQLSKTGKSGEYVSKGGFVVVGKTTYVPNKINLALGIDPEGHILAGPKEAVLAHCRDFVELQQGDIKPSEIAKQIKHKLKSGTVDEIIRALPAGCFRCKQPQKERVRTASG